ETSDGSSNEFPKSDLNSQQPSHLNPNFSTGGYLVVCKRKGRDLIPMFNNLTVIRLHHHETPPPWNATAFLQMKDSESCKTHPYFIEALHRKKSAKLLSLDKATSLSVQDGALIDGVYWPPVGLIRDIHNRPAIIGFRGEVFWRDAYKSCEDYDFVVSREIQTPGQACFNVHFLQGVSTLSFRKESDGYGYEISRRIYEGKVTHPHKPNGVVNYTKFCSFLIRKDGYKYPTKMFNESFYDIDAIVRHIFFREISKRYKPCECIEECPGNPYDTAFKCLIGSKFSINMENTQIDGYISEKIFNGAMAGGVPIYFGAPDVGRYLNTRSFVYCNVSHGVIKEMRSFYPRTKRPRRFYFHNRTKKSPWPTDEELFEWAEGYLLPELDSCIERVMELDKDDNLYLEVLNEAFITNPDIMSGEYPFRGVMRAYEFARNRQEKSL
ncbi:hypothetical protein ACHAXS_000472, partial [Conticribra weissflogii]